jgi:hypothetical protein
MAPIQSDSTGKEIRDADKHLSLDPRASSQDISDLEAGMTDEKLPSKTRDTEEINWESDDDPANPLNWSPFRKWQNLGVISIMSLTTYSSTSSPRRSQVNSSSGLSAS